MNPDCNHDQSRLPTASDNRKDASATGKLTDEDKKVCKEIGRALAKIGDHFDNVNPSSKPVVVYSFIAIAKRSRRTFKG